MNSIEIKNQSQLTVQNNLLVLSQFALNNSFSFQIVKEKTEGDASTQWMIKRSGFIREIFYRIFYNEQTHLKNLKEIIKSNISLLEETDSSWFLKNDQTYTDLFLAVQKTIKPLWLVVHQDQDFWTNGGILL